MFEKCNKTALTPEKGELKEICDFYNEKLEEHKKNIGLKSLFRNAKPVKCIETNKIYRSSRVACEELGLKYNSSISLCCTGKRKKAYGLTWEYV